MPGKLRPRKARRKAKAKASFATERVAGRKKRRAVLERAATKGPAKSGRLAARHAAAGARAGESVATRITSLAEYMTFLETDCVEDDIAFRGQRTEWPLVPKVARIRPRTNLKDDEAALLRAFRRQAVPLLRWTPSTTWDWLAVGQHHGLPTRLLDWTRNPLAALWFAVREVPRPGEEFGVVWVFRPDQRSHVLDPATVDPFRGNTVRLFEPRHISERIRTQDGLFTVHPLVRSGGGWTFRPLDQSDAIRRRLHEIVVPSAAFSTIRFQLRRCGIHDGVLFPDLDGVARGIEWDNTLLADESDGD